MQSRDYWDKRFEELEAKQHEDAEKKLESLLKEYDDAVEEVERIFAKFYLRYAKDGIVTNAEARRILNSAEMVEFRKIIRKMRERAEDKTWKKKLEKFELRQRVTRLELLLLQLQDKLDYLAYRQRQTVIDVVEKQHEHQYLYVLFLLQVGLGTLMKVTEIPILTLEELLTTVWAMDGKSFAERVVTVAERHKREVERILIQGFSRGDPPQKIIDELVKRFNMSRNNAKRLVMTEQNYFNTKATAKAFANHGVKTYRFVATIDSRTSDICRSMHRKTFPMSEMRIGINAPPLHPNCRSVIVPVREVETPLTISFNEWIDKFVNKLSSI